MAIRPTGHYVSKNKGSKKSKSRAKENRFSKKQFFNLCTPNVFPVTVHGKTSHPRTKAKQDLSSFLIGRTFSVNQGDLNGANTETHRNFCFKVSRVRGSDCLSEFDGMYMARDKVNNLIKKNTTLIDAYTDIETSNGSVFRFFVTATTKFQAGQVKSNAYCQTSSAKKIRKMIVETINQEVAGLDVDKIINKLSTEYIGKMIESKCSKIFPINAVIRKVKPIKNLVGSSVSSNTVGFEDVEEQQNEFVIATA